MEQRMPKRRLFKQTTSLKERLAKEVTQLRKQAQGTPPGFDCGVADKELGRRERRREWAPFSLPGAREKRPQGGGGGVRGGPPFKPPATRKQAANGEPNYRNSSDRSELVWSTQLATFHI